MVLVSVGPPVSWAQPRDGVPPSRAPRSPFPLMWPSCGFGHGSERGPRSRSAWGLTSGLLRVWAHKHVLEGPFPSGTDCRPHSVPRAEGRRPACCAPRRGAGPRLGTRQGDAHRALGRGAESYSGKRSSAALWRRIEVQKPKSVLSTASRLRQTEPGCPVPLGCSFYKVTCGILEGRCFRKDFLSSFKSASKGREVP